MTKEEFRARIRAMDGMSYEEVSAYLVSLRPEERLAVITQLCNEMGRQGLADEYAGTVKP
jgi:hypothetical protein